MRIISGKLKGQQIAFLKNQNTRPLKDSVRENIFNILLHSKLVETNLINANILDLYSGFGSFGLEAISRGAKMVTFVEKDEKATEILKNNLFKLKIINKAKILKNNLFKLKIINKAKIFKKNVDEVLLSENLKKYDIYFFDPPYKDKNFLNVLLQLKKKLLSKKEVLIIIHREKRAVEKFDGVFKTFFEKIYGRSKIIFGKF